MDGIPPGSSVHETSQARILKWVATAFLQGMFLTQGSNLCLLLWQEGSLPLSHQGGPKYKVRKVRKVKTHSCKVLYVFQRVCITTVPLSPTSSAEAGQEPLAMDQSWGQQTHRLMPCQGDRQSMEDLGSDSRSTHSYKAGGKIGVANLEPTWLLFLITSIMDTGEGNGKPL